MADVQTYIDGINIAKENMLAVVTKSKEAMALLKAMQEESKVEFPYIWYLDEVARSASEFVQQANVDIEAFELKLTEGEETEDEPETAPEAAKTLEQLVL